jgi:hypothetical protein
MVVSILGFHHCSIRVELSKDKDSFLSFFSLVSKNPRIKIEVRDYLGLFIEKK